MFCLFGNLSDDVQESISVTISIPKQEKLVIALAKA